MGVNKMNMKRCLSGLLALMMLLSTQLTSFAAGSGSSAGQGNTGNGGATSSVGNGTWNTTANTGFRFTIVNGEGDPVSHILGKSNTVSLDVLNSGIKEAGEFWTACATDPNQARDAHSPYIMSMSQFMKGIKEESHGPLYWMDGAENPLGNQVREFILKGANTSGSSSGGISGEGSGAGSTAGTDLEDSDAIEEFSLYYSNYDEWVSESAAATSKEDMEILINKISSQRATFKSKVDSLITPERYGSNFGYSQWRVVGDWNTWVGKVEDNIAGKYPELVAKYDNSESLGMFGFKWVEFEAIEEARKDYNSKQNKTSLDLSFLNPFNWFSMTSYAAVGEPSGSGNESSPTTDSVGLTENRDSVLEKILNIDIGGTFVFQLDGAATQLSEAQSGSGKYPSQVFIEKGYVLLVEATIQGMPQEYKGDWTNYPSLVYGTAHNWAQFGQTPGWKRVYSGNSFGNHQRYLNKDIPNGLVTVSDWIHLKGEQVLLTPHGGKWSNSEMIQKFNYGYGCHLYTGLDIGKVPASSIDTGNPPPSETYEKEYFVLNRFFRKKNKDNTYTYDKYDSHTYKVTSDLRNVVINTSTDGYGLVEWGSSETEYYIPSKLEPWEEVSKHNTGSEKGTTTKTLEIKTGTPIKTINVLYEQIPSTKVIKVYDNSEGETEKVVGPDPVEGTTYTPPTDPDYVYTEIKVSENPPKTVTTWEDSEGGSKGNPPSIPVGEKDNTIYVHYEKDPTSDAKKIVLYENELSWNYDLRDLVESRVLASIYDSVPAADYFYPTCPEHDCGDCRGNDEDGYWCPGHTCRNKSKKFTDQMWSFTLVDNFNQNSLPFIKDWTYTSNMSARGFATWEGGNGANYKVTPQATFLLTRDKSQDVVTLYPNKNTSHLGELSSLGLSESYTSADTRKNHQRETSSTKKFYETVQTGLTYGSHDTGLSWQTRLSGYSSHTESGSYDTYTAAGHSPEDANSLYSKSGNVEERYFLGKSGKGEQIPRPDATSSWQSKYKYNSTYASTSAMLSFYPYLKYDYHYKGDSSVTPIMVTSSNLSEMKVFNAIQAGVYKKNEINANLDSTQWSTHQRSLTFLSNLGISDKKSVLPGGAIQDIDMGNQGDTQVGITLWQSCLPDSQVVAVQEGFKVSESEARTAATTLQEEIKKTITGYGLVQWGREGSSTAFDDVLLGDELHESTAVSFISGNNGSTSSDDKYYLRHDGTGSNRANFDVLDSRINSQVVYTIKSDTDGNVWVEKDGTELGRINKSQNASSLLSNAEIKLLDDNTKLITNYVSAIQRNAGTSRTGQKWHNEAFDGVSVLKTEMTFDVGFSQNGSKRTNVLDPLLTGNSTSKSDLYNFSDDSKVRTSVYATTATSTTATNGKQGYLGTLKGINGMGDLETGLSDIQSFVHTKLFYIPNANVSDLN